MKQVVAFLESVTGSGIDLKCEPSFLWLAIRLAVGSGWRENNGMKVEAVSRRRFVSSAVVGGMFSGFGDLGILGRLPLVSAEEARPDPDIVRFRPEIEPTVRLIETTPQKKLIEVVAERVRNGKLSYQELLGALFLAAVKREITLDRLREIGRNTTRISSMVFLMPAAPPSIPPCPGSSTILKV